MNTVLVIALVFTALFGGAAGTAYAAQDDLPTEALYPVKTLTEDARLALTSNPQARLNLLGALAQTRTQEMVQLAEAGVVPPEATLLRLQEHTRLAFDLAAAQPEPEMLRSMEQIRSQLQTQLQLINECTAQGDPLRTLAQTRLMIQLRLQLLEDGLADPQAFRNTVRNGPMPEEPGGFGPGGQPEVTPGSGSGYGPGGQPEATPGSGSGYGPGNPPEATPGDGSGYGPGNPPESTPAEGDGYGPGNPPEATPGDGSGYGPGNPPEATPNPPGSGSDPNPTKAPDKDSGSGSGGGGGGRP